MVALLKTTQIQVPASATVNLTLDASGGVTVGQNLTVTGTTTFTGGSTFTGNATAAAFIPSGSTVPTNGLYRPAANTVGLATNSTNALYIDASQNVGIGVTPSASWLGQSAIQVNSKSAFAGSAQYTSVATNAVATSAGWAANYLSTGFATLYTQQVSNGQHQWFNAPSGTAGTAITFTQAMTLDASGNLGIGTSSPTKKLQVYTTDPTTVSATNIMLQGGQSGYGAGVSFSSIPTGGSSVVEMAKITADGESAWNTTAATQNAGLRFFTANTGSLSERMRIDSSGNLLVGVTTSQNGALITNNGSYTQNGNQMNFNSSSTTIEFVNRNSGGAKTYQWYVGASGGSPIATLSTSGVWTNASDARGKYNIADIHYGLDTVMALTPRQYDVKSDGSHAIGFIAQEVQPIIPELVHLTNKSEDNEFYGLDYGSMVAVLVKAIQEQQAQITSLKAELDALKTKVGA